MNNFIQNEVIIKTKRNLSIEQINDTNFYAFVDNFESISNGVITKKTCFGITSLDNLNKVKNLEPVNTRIKNNKLYLGSGFIVAINKENFKKVLSGNLYITEVIEEITQEIYKSNEYEFIIWNSASYKALDLYENFISLPIYFSYIDGGIDNSNFELDKLLEVLKHDKNVCDKENLKISYIPSYNCDKGRDKTIEFKYLLPTDVYEKVESLKLDTFDKQNYIIKNIISTKNCFTENSRYNKL